MQLAAQLPDLLWTCLHDFPRALFAYPTSAKEAATDLSTMTSFIYGRDEEKTRIERERAALLCRDTPSIATLLTSLPAAPDKYAALIQLKQLYMSRDRRLLHLSIGELETEVHNRHFIFSHLVNTNKSFTDIFQVLKRTQANLGSGGAGDAGSTDRQQAPADDQSPLPPADLAKEAINLAIADRDFQTAARLISAVDTSKLDGQMEVIQLAFASGSMLMQRFLTYEESKIEGKHEVFGKIRKQLYLRGRFFGQAAAMRPDGTVPELAKNFALGETELAARDASLASNAASVKFALAPGRGAAAGKR